MDYRRNFFYFLNKDLSIRFPLQSLQNSLAEKKKPMYQFAEKIIQTLLKFQFLHNSNKFEVINLFYIICVQNHHIKPLLQHLSLSIVKLMNLLMTSYRKYKNQRFLFLFGNYYNLFIATIVLNNKISILRQKSYNEERH